MGAPADLGNELLRDDASAWLVLWLSDDDLPNLDTLISQAGPSGRIYLSSSLLGNLSRSVPDGLPGNVYAVHPFDLPEAAARRRRPVEIWLRSNGIEAGEAYLQMNALFTVTVVAQALKHVGSNFYRDYFLERVEHILDSMVTPSAYPNLTLAPHQRFASNGCYIVRVSQGNDGDSSPAKEWIIP